MLGLSKSLKQGGMSRTEGPLINLALWYYDPMILWFTFFAQRNSKVAALQETILFVQEKLKEQLSHGFVCLVEKKHLRQDVRLSLEVGVILPNLRRRNTFKCGGVDQALTGIASSFQAQGRHSSQVTVMWGLVGPLPCKGKPSFQTAIAFFDPALDVKYSTTRAGAGISGAISPNWRTSSFCQFSTTFRGPQTVDCNGATSMNHCSGSHRWRSCHELSRPRHGIR